MTYNLFKASDARDRCAIVLAGGDGVRLRPFVQKLRGDELPKQYVKLLSGQSMLEATLQRTRKLVPSTRQFVVVTERHFDYLEVARQLASYPGIQVHSQPCNRGTGMGLLLSLAQVHRRHPESIIVIFPSDHFIREEDLFLTHVDAACRLVEQNDSNIVLLGIVPNAPETEYGYILASRRWHIAFPFGAREVARFIEKPDPILARKLMLQGGFWNTMVIVFKTKTLLAHIRAISPLIYLGFQRICGAVGGQNFGNVVKQVFAESQPLNLSKGLLEVLAVQRKRSLLVLPVRGVHWCDWGSEERIINTLAHTNRCRFGLEPSGRLFDALLRGKAAGCA